MRQLKITKQITHRDEESINRYFHDISKCQMVSPEEEVQLANLIKKGDTEALRRLVVANLRFVISVAKQYQGQGLSFPDLINEGNVGLIKAAEKFDATKGFKFISYAVWWIRQSITQAISDQTRTVRLPLNKISSIKKISNAIPYLEQEFEREPTEDEIADYLDVTCDEVKSVNYIKKRQISLDMPISKDDSSEESLSSLISSNDIPPPDSNIMRESVVTDITRALKKLSIREAKIITMSFGLCNSPIYTLHEIATKCNISSERARQIKSNGLIKLKYLLKRKLFLIEF